MNRDDLEQFINENYNAESDYPWLKYPNYEVFRHSNNRKWFALIMDIPKNKLGLPGTDIIDVVNFECCINTFSKGKINTDKKLQKELKTLIYSGFSAPFLLLSA